MKSQLRHLKKQLAQAADALRFETAGDYLPLTRKTALLATAGIEPSPADASLPVETQPKRKIALLAEEQIGAATLNYALNVCERMDADLEVLVGPEMVTPPGETALVHCERPVHCHVQRLGPNFIAQVARYIATTHGLLFVVAAAGDAIAEQATDRSAQRLGLAGQVPWVVVAE